jgi:hypothetical protein
MGSHGNPLLRELRDYTRQHPQVIITPPEETMSRLWEVSLPRSATMAFDSLEMLLLALSMTSIPGDDEDPV